MIINIIVLVVVFACGVAVGMYVVTQIENML